MRLLSLTVLLVSTALPLCSANQPCGSYLGCHASDSKMGNYSRAAVATDAHDCARPGRWILQIGGSAADAAVTVLLCMGLVNPHSSGLGGGAFFTYYESSTGRATVVDAREEAPSAATVNMFDGNSTESEMGGLSIAVPAELAGMWQLHRRFGRLPWSTLFIEPIAMASAGVRVGKHLAKALHQDADLIRTRPRMRRAFFDAKTGKVLKEGDLMRRPDLAATFLKLSTGGAALFYNGSWGRVLADEIQAAGGLVTADDIRAYQPRVYEALKMDIASLNATMFGVRPPGSGALLGFMLNVMGGYGQGFYPSAKSTPDGAALYFHRLVETFKFAYARRMQLGDEKYDNVTDVMRDLMSAEFADLIRSKIDDTRTYFDPQHYGFDQRQRPDHGTAHMNVIDSDGNAVAVTTTVNLYFGSKVMSPSTGILFNDQMDDFSLPNITSAFNVPPSRFNHIAPGKRPMSSMTPAVIVDQVTKRPILVIGAEGGTQITTSVTAAVIRMLLFGDDVKTAVDAPRVHDQLFPNTTMVEKYFPVALRDALAERGHLVEQQPYGSEITAIRIDDDRIYANSDYRKGGSVDGLDGAGENDDRR